MGIRLAIDIGGTFTDLAAYVEETGQLVFTKSSTTPRELTEAMVRCLDKAGVAASGVETFIHGSTIGINTIIQRTGPPTALITTKGFRDVYEMGRRNRPEIYDLFFHRPRPLVPRDLRYEVVERLSSEGQVKVALDEQQVRDVLRQMGQRGIAAVAVCLLHSYANPDHEQRVGALARELLPEAFVSVSSDIHREYREYERTSTTVMNAYLGPVVGRYLQRLGERLSELRFGGRILIMQSSGGVMSLDAAAKQPVRIIESGPAGGVAGTLYLCEQLGYRNAIAFDMGGTTVKACLIDNGRAKVTTDYYVGGRVTGLPAQVPFLDLIEIGAGGGSLAWVDPVGALRVGPLSAGADPGPACYGLGGSEPTVTDANVLVGKIDPARFLGGEMPLDRRLAEEAVARVGQRVGLDPLQTANGIVRIANAMMARAISKVSVERGYDPRDFALVAYGGGGPMHATALARELQIPHVVVPQAPAEFSALGMLCTDLRHDFTRTAPTSIADLPPAELEARFAALELAAAEQLAAEGVDGARFACVRTADVRYVGQFHTIGIGVPSRVAGRADLDGISQRFHEAHDAAYGHAAPREATEIINLRLAALVRLAKPQFPPLERDGQGPPPAAYLGRRRVLWEDGSWHDCPIYEREALRAGNVVVGPAVVHERASVIPIGPHDRLEVDAVGHLHIAIHGGK
ncbi:MAG: hydantoinase/oxoprolinase family protein [Chloroflexi bacterium]|nr:hydantoinase/oxoprolinase family protein [Chloroflexota bacterium]